MYLTEKAVVKKDNRPINVGTFDLLIFKWPFAAIVSITHRIAGVALMVVIGIGLYALELSLSSEAEFNELKMMMASPLVKIVIWGSLSALAYHFVAGVKHLIVDFGVGETLESGLFAARMVVLVSIILIVLAGVWVFKP